MKKSSGINSTELIFYKSIFRNKKFKHSYYLEITRVTSNLKKWKMPI